MWMLMDWFFLFYYTDVKRVLRFFSSHLYLTFNSSPRGQNGHHLTDDILICIFVNETFCILIKLSLKLASRGPIDNNPALVQITA